MNQKMSYVTENLALQGSVQDGVRPVACKCFPSSFEFASTRSSMCCTYAPRIQAKPSTARYPYNTHLTRTQGRPPVGRASRCLYAVSRCTCTVLRTLHGN